MANEEADSGHGPSPIGSQPAAPREPWVCWFMPSLVATLLARETEAGRPLLEDEVLRIRDQAPCVAVPTDLVPQLETARGYQDLDPEDCWQAWQDARSQLK